MRELKITDELKRKQQEILKDLEDLRKVAEMIARGPGGREVSLTITKLQEAHSWLLLALQELEGANTANR